MKTIREELCGIISDLDVICKSLSSIRREVEIAPSPLPVDDHFKFLLACERIRETIEILGGITKETESVTSTT